MTSIIIKILLMLYGASSKLSSRRGAKTEGAKFCPECGKKLA
jgi:hypothetical protein